MAPADAAEALFRKAQELARKEQYGAAEDLAQRAKRLIEASPGYEKNALAIEKVRRLTEFIVLCRKSVAGTGSGGAEPNPVPYNSAPWGSWEIPPPGTVRPSGGGGSGQPPAANGPTWSDLNRGIAAFVSILDTLNPTEPPPADKTDAALVELGKLIPFGSPELASLASGSYTTLKMARQRIWILAEDEVAALQEYVRTHLSKPATLSDTEAISFLIKSFRDLRITLPGERRAAVRAMALAHIERLVSTGYKTRLKLAPEDAELLGLVPHGDIWVTVESKVKEDLAGLGPEGLEKRMTELLSRREPEVQILAMRALLLRVFESFGADQAAFMDEMKKRAATFDVGSAEIRSEMERIRTGLSKTKTCSRCKGTHEIKCTNGCNENGEFVKVCGHCQGTGRVAYQGREILYQNRQMEGDHRQVTKCSKCKGNKRSACTSCKEPWKPPSLESMVRPVPCGLCHQGGFLRSYLRLMCPDCFGIGRKFEEPK